MPFVAVISTIITSVTKKGVIDALFVITLKFRTCETVFFVGTVGTVINVVALFMQHNAFWVRFAIKGCRGIAITSIFIVISIVITVLV